MRRGYFKLPQIAFLTIGDGGRYRFKRSYKWRQEETGGVGDCRRKQDTYKRMSASRIRRNVRRAEVKVSAVFAVVYRKQSVQSLRGLGDLTQCLQGGEPRFVPVWKLMPVSLSMTQL